MALFSSLAFRQRVALTTRTTAVAATASAAPNYTFVLCGLVFHLSFRIVSRPRPHSRSRSPCFGCTPVQPQWFSFAFYNFSLLATTCSNCSTCSTCFAARWACLQTTITLADFGCFAYANNNNSKQLHVVSCCRFIEFLHCFTINFLTSFLCRLHPRPLAAACAHLVCVFVSADWLQN